MSMLPGAHRVPTGAHALRLLERIAEEPAPEENLTTDEARVAGLVAMHRARRRHPSAHIANSARTLDPWPPSSDSTSHTTPGRPHPPTPRPSP